MAGVAAILGNFAADSGGSVNAAARFPVSVVASFIGFSIFWWLTIAAVIPRRVVHVFGVKVRRDRRRAIEGSRAGGPATRKLKITGISGGTRDGSFNTVRATQRAPAPWDTKPIRCAYLVATAGGLFGMFIKSASKSKGWVVTGKKKVSEPADFNGGGAFIVSSNGSEIIRKTDTQLNAVHRAVSRDQPRGLCKPGRR